MTIEEKTSGRGFSLQFIEALKYDTGLGLNRILELVKNDTSLCLEIRKNYINIYYRGGNLIKLSEDRGRYSVYFDTNYFKNDTTVPLPPSILSSYRDVTDWLNIVPLLKNKMDLWFGQNPKNEREFQQLLVRENNFKGAAKGTDYFICDIEYANALGRFDLVAAYWPSSGAKRKNNKDVGLALIEMKYLDKALTRKSGIMGHIQGIKQYLTPQNLSSLKEEMKTVFHQKHKLGLIDNQKPIEKFSDRKPECIFIFINHDPDSVILLKELEKIKAISDDLPFDLKFASSNFMGYGLYKQNIHGLDEFMARFERQIYAKG